MPTDSQIPSQHNNSDRHGFDLYRSGQEKKIEHFLFSGNAGEYFWIYMVNNIFTLLTLGIYSAWAKVRTLQYFYGNTELGGARFQFTANPLVILRERIIAVLLLLLYFAAENVQSN